MDHTHEPVGIASVGMYLPERVITAAEIAAESGLPEWVVREKLGIVEKRMAPPDLHPNEMGVLAARDCLAQCDIPPEEIDLVICTTEEWREYLLWTSGIDLAYQIGATRAWGMDMHMRCCTTVAAMKIAKDIMQSDPEIRTVLIAGGYRIGDLINFKNLRTSFLFNIGAGAGAMLLRRGWPRNHVLGSHLITDGSMSRDVLVPASGTVQFPTDEAVAKGLFKFDLVNEEKMKARLNEVSMDNWMRCIDEALRKSGHTRDDVDFLNMVLIKPSGYREMLSRLGLTEEQGVYNDRYGHIGEQDTIINIIEGLRLGRLKNGDLMVMVGAGIGYVWGAGVVRWGPCQEGDRCG
ncbi:MAG: 3-oxoacyl-ACP synthase [Candidatus Acetothermia bacterium]|jgi:3-oxoacyl-[acyl-carrier-protein] synthase-3|nr:3-oxoacyl-ACP synthase [Candidatus Acetothermia bacterium]